MKISFKVRDKSFSSDLSKPHEISIPLQFSGAQPNHFGVEAASREVIKQGSYIGDVKQGGSCNCYQYTVTPHCNGTHTECVGHITEEELSVSSVLKKSLFKATLVTVTPTPAPETEDSYIPSKDEADKLITARELKKVLDGKEQAFLEALIVRTLPNDPSKKSRNYPENPPPYFSLEAIEYVVSLGVRHLLLDIPSVDRMYDDGKLSCHRRFWSEGIDSTNTITEMIYIDDSVKDGSYLVEIQIPSFVADAAPSRVFLHQIKGE